MFRLLEEIFPVFIVLAIVAAVVYAIVAARRRPSVPETDPGIGTVRRLYFYVVSFVALMMAANGVVQIIKYLLDARFGGTLVTPSNTGLAVGVSLTVVGLPLWALHWVIVQRHVKNMPVETRSVLRKLYIYVVLGVAGALVIISAVNLLQFIFRSEESFKGYHWGAVIVWSAVWVFYWLLERAEGQATDETLGIRRFYVYLASLVTLIMLSIGFGRVVHVILLEGYDALVSQPVVLPTGIGLWRLTLRGALAIGIVGGAAWGAHWLYFARRDFGSALRQIYLYIFALLGGVVTALVSLGIIINGVLTWLIGVGPDETAAMHFRFLPAALAALSVGAGLWAYHWGVVRREAEASAQESQGARRFYAYVLAALGLVALGVAAGTVTHLALALLTESGREVVAGRDIWRGPVAAAITLAVLGAPIWGYYWNSVQRQVSAAGVEERMSLMRRAFIFIVLGGGVLTLLGSVSALLFFFLRDLLGGGLSIETVRDARAVASIIVAVAVFLPYYWKVYQQDRQAEPAEMVGRPARKDVSVLVSAGGEAFVRSLEAALGYRVSALRWADPDASLPPLSEAESQELAQRVSSASGTRVLLIPNGATVRVVSYN